MAVDPADNDTRMAPCGRDGPSSTEGTAIVPATMTQWRNGTKCFSFTLLTILRVKSCPDAQAVRLISARRVMDLQTIRPGVMRGEFLAERVTGYGTHLCDVGR